MTQLRLARRSSERAAAGRSLLVVRQSSQRLDLPARPRCSVHASPAARKRCPCGRAIRCGASSARSRLGLARAVGGQRRCNEQRRVLAVAWCHVQDGQDRVLGIGLREILPRMDRGGSSQQRGRIRPRLRRTVVMPWCIGVACSAVLLAGCGHSEEDVKGICELLGPALSQGWAAGASRMSISVSPCSGPRISVTWRRRPSRVRSPSGVSVPRSRVQTGDLGRTS